MSDTHWQSVRRILCIRLDNLGDVLMTTPAMHALKCGGPGRHLTLLASRSGAMLAPHLPDVDEVWAYDAPWVKGGRPDLASDQRLIERMAGAAFDAAVIFTVYSQSPLPAALMCRLAGIPRVLAHCRENPYALLTDWLKESEPAPQVRHEVQRQLDLVAHVGAAAVDRRLRFAPCETDHASLSTKLADAGLDDETQWVVAHCGATAASRRYPIEFYAQALELLGNRGGSVVLTGDSSERALTAQIMRSCGSTLPLIDFAGRLSLGEFACLIQRASLLLSNNTGPVHLAAALGTPVVDLYALTNPQHTPWQVPHKLLFHDVPCRNCYRSECPEQHHACLRGVSPERVCAAVLELLAETRQFGARVAGAH